MAWAFWLAGPVVAPLLVALGTWLRAVRSARAARRMTTAQAMQAHREFLDALTVPARSAHRGLQRPSQERPTVDS